MTEQDEHTAGTGISYAGLGGGEAHYGGVRVVDPDPSAVKLPARVDFGIDSLGRWSVEVRAEDGTLLDLTDDGLGEGPVDLSAYPTDNPAGAVGLQAELQRRFPDSQIIWRPGVMNSLDEHTAAAHRALATAAKDRKAARAATETANASLRTALRLAKKAELGPADIATRTGYARSTITSALSGLPATETVPAR